MKVIRSQCGRIRRRSTAGVAVGFVFIYLVGCGDSSNVTGPSSVGEETLLTIDLSESIEANSERSVTASEETSDSVQKPPPGQFTLEASQGTVNLQANSASRLTIIEGLADLAGFSLDNASAQDANVTLSLQQVNMMNTLDQLLEHERYHAIYAPEVNRQGFRLRELLIGYVQQENILADQADSGSDLGANKSGTELLPASDFIYLGDAQYEVDLVYRLEHETPDNRAHAVSELMMTPTGFEAAYHVFKRDESPEVRLAVLELVGTEDLYLAKQMVVAALQDPYPELVIYALEIIESTGDYSLVRHIEPLANHSSVEVRDYAREVQESLTAAYFAPEEYAENIPTSISGSIEHRDYDPGPDQ